MAITLFRRRTPRVRTANDNQSTEVRTHMAPSTAVDPHGDRLDFLNTNSDPTTPLSDPVATSRPNEVPQLQPRPNTAADDFEPPRYLAAGSPSPVQHNVAEPLVDHLATGQYLESYAPEVALLPSGRAQGTELAGHRIPRRVLENETHELGGDAAWQPNSGKVMTTRGPLADEPLQYPEPPSGWLPNGISTTPTLAPPGWAATPIKTSTPNTPWEASLSLDSGG